MKIENSDPKTVAAFGDEWSRHQQSDLSDSEASAIFESYFSVFPWHLISKNSVGFDMGSGSGRWAQFVAPRVGKLICVDASVEALAVAKKNLNSYGNVDFVHAAANGFDAPAGSMDFGYSLGVLHHIPDTLSAMQACTAKLKPGAPFLVYLYYDMENRPAWFRFLWKCTDVLRQVTCNLPPAAKSAVCNIIAYIVYWPLTRFAWLIKKLGLNNHWIPLSAYADRSMMTLKTDSRDRFGTPLEQRFSREQIHEMMERAGLQDIVFRDGVPYWCAVGTRRL
jgi:SAM-dependent methyltransferase